MSTPVREATEVGEARRRVQQLIDGARASPSTGNAQATPQATPYWQGPADAQPRFLQAAVMRRESRWSDLATLAREWLRHATDDAEPWHLLGMALTRLDKPAEALDALECSLHLWPSHGAVRSSLDALRISAPALPTRPQRAAPCQPAKL